MPDSASLPAASLLRPTPSEPTPAYASAATVTTTYVTSRTTVEMTAARPGVTEESLVSSFAATAESQPQ
jgi:hypothetical protein